MAKLGSPQKEAQSSKLCANQELSDYPCNSLRVSCDNQRLFANSSDTHRVHKCDTLRVITSPRQVSPLYGTRRVHDNYQDSSNHRSVFVVNSACHVDIPTPKVDQAIVDAQVKIYKETWPHPTPQAWQLFPDFCTLYEEVKSYNLPNFLGAKKTLDSGLNLPQWDKVLATYHDNEICHFLRYGWPLGYHKPTPPSSATENHHSANAFPAHIQAFIEEELSHKAIVGPFPAAPFDPWTRASPIMTRPKRDSDKRRIIVDLSYPEGDAVNDGINISSIYGRDTTYSLPSINDLVLHIKNAPKTAWIWKADLSRAYRQLRVDPIDTPLLAIKFSDCTYIDLCPPFGCRSSSGACHRVSQAVVYLMAQKGFTVLAFLDDFAGCEQSKDKADAAYTCFLQLTASLGLSLAHAKCAPPSTAMQWLGYDIDTCNMLLSIPQDKMREVLAHCQLWGSKLRASRLMIQSLIGKLLHLANCVRHARKFTSRILATLRRMGENDKTWITLDEGFKADVSWFRHYASSANGVSLLSPIKETIYIECDSSLSGGGGSSISSYYRWTYTDEHVSRFPLIHQLEALNLLVAYRTLCPKSNTEGKLVIILTDNLSSSYALTSGKTKDPVLAACAREMWLFAAIADHDIEIQHKSGALIPLADALSRYSFDCSKAALADHLIREHNLTQIHPCLSNYVFFNSI